MARLAAVVACCVLTLAGAVRPSAEASNSDLLQMIQDLQGRVADLEGRKTTLCCMMWNDKKGKEVKKCTTSKASCGDHTSGDTYIFSHVADSECTANTAKC